MQETPPVLPIMRTKTQYRLLVELFFRAKGLRTLSDLARSISVDQTTVMREVNRLLETGVILEERVGRSRTVKVNDASPYTGPLRELIRVAEGHTYTADGAVARGHRGRRHERRPMPSSRRSG